MIFKENWEKTNAKLHLLDGLILKMLGTYFNENDIKSVSVIGGGCANINILAHLKNANDPVILRVYLLDGQSAYREQKASELLNGKLPVPKFYHIAESFGYTFAITEYFPGKTLRSFLLSDKKIDISRVMFKVGEALGVISNITFPSSGVFNRNLEIKKIVGCSLFINFCLKNTNVKTIITQEQRRQIKNLFKTYKNLLPDETDRSLVHADFNPANILVVENKGELEISGILDWQFSFSGSSLFDVANMLRYAHKMPDDYQNSFLEGLLSTHYQLPNSWQITTHLLNILLLLDCLSRSVPENSPNQTEDIKELISHILWDLKKNESTYIKCL